MMNPETINQWAETWGRFIVTGLIDSTVILAIAALIWAFARKKASAQFGYWLFVMVLIKPLIPVEITVPAWMSYASPPHTIKQVAQWSPAHSTAVQVERSAFVQQDALYGPSFEDKTNFPVDSATIAPSFQIDTDAQTIPFSTHSHFLFFWMGTISLLLTGFVWMQWKTRVVFKNSIRLDPNALPVDFFALKKAVGVRKEVSILINGGIPSPAISGIIHPKLILPADLHKTLTPNQWTWVLLHELAHVRRCDLLASLFQRIMKIVFFFNPAVWIASWAADQLREYACDDTALAACNTPRRDCGEGFITLVERAQTLSTPVHSALGLFNPGTLIRQRLIRILDTRRRITRKLSWSAALCLTLLAIAVLPIVRAEQTNSAPQPSALSNTGSYTFKGTVSDFGTDKIIKGASVRLLKLNDVYTPYQDPEQLVSETQTDAHGQFCFTGVSAGVYRFTVTAKGRYEYRPHGTIGVVQAHERIILDDKHPVIDVDVRMHPGCALRVKVVDSNQKPVPGSEVTVLINNMYFSASPQITDERGACFFDTLLYEKGRVVVRCDGYGEVISNMFQTNTIDNPTEITVQLPPPSSISGQVTNRDGSPVAGVRLYAIHSDVYRDLASVRDLKKHSVVSDENGFYQFDNLGKGTYSIRANDANVPSDRWYDTEHLDITIGESENRKNVNMQAAQIPTGDVRGIVKNRDGKPIANAQIHYETLDFHIEGIHHYPGGSTNGFVNTNDDGEFIVENIVIGKTAEIEVSAKGYLRNKQTYNRFDESIEIVLEPAGTIRGNVIDVDTKKPITGAQITIDRGWPPIESPSSYTHLEVYTTSGNDGSFVLESVNAIPVRLITNASGYTSVEGPTIRIKSGDDIGPITIAMQRGKTLKGKIVDADGNPIPNAQLGLRSKDINRNRHISGSNYRDAVQSTVDGSFEIVGVPVDGDYLTVRHPDFTPKYMEITPAMLEEGDAAIVLTQGGTLEGRAVYSNGAPEQNAQIHVTNAPENSFGYHTKTDANGEYRITKLPDIEFYVRKGSVMSNDPHLFESRIVKIQDGQTVRADFGMGDGATLSGTVFKNGKPERNVQVTIKDYYGRFGYGWNITTESKEDGTYALHNVPPGDWMLETWQGGDTAQYQHITIEPDQNEYHLDLGVDLYKIVVTVIDAETNEPLTDIPIRTAFVSSLPTNHTLYLHGATDEKGKAVFQPKEAGKYDLQVWKEGYQAQFIKVKFAPIDPGEKKSIKTVDVKLQKAQRELEARLTLNGEPFITKHLRFTAYVNDYLFPFTSKADSDNPNRHLITGLPVGTFELMCYAGDGNHSYHAIPETVTVREGRRSTVALSMIQTHPYQFRLIEKSGTSVKQEFGKIEFLDYPSFNSYHNKVFIDPFGYVLHVPLGGHPIRLSVPGYKPLEFIPDDLANPSPEGSDYSTLVYLTLDKED